MERIRIVLCRPSHPGNIGAAARAMKAMGLSDLRLVAPEHFPAPNALIGSIGVISAGPRVPDLLARLGVQVQETKAGRLKGAGAPWRLETPEEAAKVLRSVRL